MIQVKNITKSFDGKTILHDVDATFLTGKTNLIIGQSGSGKTVLMKSIVGLIRPDSGEILYDGRDLLKMNSSQVKDLRREIGMLFQGSALFDSETVLGNVMFPLVMFSDMSREEMLDRAHFCLDRVNLKGADSKYPAEISGGERQRTAVARSLINQPLIILADEPTGNLDSKSSRTVIEAFENARKQLGATIFMVTHDSFSASFCDRVILLKDGAVYDSLTRNMTGSESRDMFQDRLLAAIKQMSAIEGRPEEQ